MQKRDSIAIPVILKIGSGVLKEIGTYLADIYQRAEDILHQLVNDMAQTGG